MQTTLTLQQARRVLGEVINGVHHGNETVTITRYGRPCAALVPMALLERLRQLDLNGGAPEPLAVPLATEV